jgi:hypothetical protein
VVGANRIRTGEGLRGSYFSAAYTVAVQFAVGQISGTVCREPSNDSENGRSATAAAESAKRECVIPVQLGVVRA